MRTGRVVCQRGAYLARGTKLGAATLRQGGAAGEADVLRVGSQVRAHEHKVQDVRHAGPRARLLLQQRGYQRVQVPAVARRDGRKPPAAGMGDPAG